MSLPLSVPCAAHFERGRPPRASRQSHQPSGVATPLTSFARGRVRSHRPAKVTGGDAYRLPRYAVAAGALWIKEVEHRSLLGVASIHGRFGRTVRALRAKAGHSQESFADAIHIHRTSMGTLERGRGNPTLETILKIARGLDLSLSELFMAVEKDSS